MTIKRLKSSPPRTGNNEPSRGASPDLKALIDRAVDERLAARSGRTRPRHPPHRPPVHAATQIRVYEDDPFLTAVDGTDPVAANPITVDVPSNDHAGLQTEIRGDQPDPDLYDPGTHDFVFWNAAAALDRGINFWAPLLPEETTWSTTHRPMQVELDDGVDLNAFYMRTRGLVFFHDTVAGDEVLSGESPDVVCHELGHAILDAVKPELFDAASMEVGAFHESFGDMSGMLSALQLPTVREFVLHQTGGDLSQNSRLSQAARELGWAIRIKFGPDAADTDCLRNAANSFVYQDPATLPFDAPSSQLSSEPHSFSRVFTGAFLDILAGMFDVGPAGPAGDDSDKLAAVSVDAGRLLVEGVRVAPVKPGYYSQVAAGMVQADQSLFGGRYRAALTTSFVRRGILAPESAVALAADLRANAGASFGVAARGRNLQFDGDNEGFRKTAADAPALPVRPLTTRFGVSVHVHMPAEPARFGVAAAAITGGADQTISPEEDARSFVEDLIQLGRIASDAAPGAIPAELIPPGEPYPTDQTHELVKEDGKVVLKRRHFDCGFCARHRRSPA